MNATSVLLAALVAALAVSSHGQDAADQRIIAEFLSIIEHMDFDRTVNVVNIKCFLHEIPCTKRFEIERKALHDLVVDGCAECSSEDKRILIHIIEKIKSVGPDYNEKFFKVIDPDGKYEKTFKDNLNKLN